MMNLSRPRGGWLPWILGAALALRLVLVTGIQGNDDVCYYEGAARLARGEPLPRHDLLQTRFALVAPVAALFRAFGPGVAGLLLPSLFASLALIVLAYALGRRWYSEAVGIVAAAYVAIFPMDVFYATASNTDVLLAVFLGAGALALTAAAEAPLPAARLGLAALAGLSFGAAHLTKESALLLIAPLLPLAWSRWKARTFGLAMTACAAVVALETAAYAAWRGDPLFRLGLTRTGYSGAGGVFERLLILPSFCAGVTGPLIAYTGGLMALSAAACGWALARDRSRSGPVAAWWLGSGLLLALWPAELFPYRPAVHFQARMYAVLILPGAILAAAFAVEVVKPRSSAAAWAGGALLAAAALVCSVRLHGDGVLWRSGVQWAHARLSEHRGQKVLTDPRSAAMLRMLSSDAPVYSIGVYGPTDAPPAPGTLLLQCDRLARVSSEWDHVEPPAWWASPPPARKTESELTVRPPWRFRGGRGSEERTRIVRILAPD